MMKRTTYKIFKTKNKEIKAEVFDTKKSYYKFVKEMKQQELTQFLLTSDLMIALIVQFILDSDKDLSGLTLYDDEDEYAKSKIEKVFRDFKEKKITETVLHGELKYIETEWSIDIMSATIGSESYGEICFKSNGVFELFDKKWLSQFITVLTKVWKLQ